MADRAELRPSERVCDWMVCGFAGWTGVCHAVVFLQGGLRAALWAVLALALAGLAVLLLARRLDSKRGRERRGGEGGAVVPAAPNTSAWLTGGAVTFSLTLPIAALNPVSVYGLWLACLAYLVAAWVFVTPPALLPFATPVRSAVWERVLWVFAALGAIVPLLFHRRSLDDAYYLNVAVAAVDSPGSPVLQADTLHGVEGLPLLLPVYKVVSFELLSAALSSLSGLTVIQIAHLVVPALFGPFVVLANARLLRRLTPQTWIWSLGALLVVLLTAADTTEFYGNFAFVRLHQGKCVFLSVIVPLLIVYGLRFSEQPGPRRWGLLAAAQVAGIGMTSSALWAGPVIAAIAVAVPLALSRRGVTTWLLGASTSVYGIGLALVLATPTAQALGSPEPVPDARSLFAFAATHMLGSGPLALVSLSATLAAWSFCRDPIARRLCIALPLATLLVLFNPFVATWIAEHSPVYRRAFWLLPIPAFLAVALTAPLHLGSASVRRGLRIGGAIALTAAFVLFVPREYVLSARNNVRFEPLGLNVPPAEFRVAEALVESVPSASYVVAPPGVSLWIGTLHDPPYALVPRALYLKSLRAHFDPADRILRLVLTDYVASRRPKDGPALLARAVDGYPLDGIALVRALPWANEIRSTLSSRGFRKTYEDPGYEVWARVL